MLGRAGQYRVLRKESVLRSGTYSKERSGIIFTQRRQQKTAHVGL